MNKSFNQYCYFIIFDAEFIMFRGDLAFDLKKKTFSVVLDLFFLLIQKL